jgi:hypothetical protein
MVSAMDPHGRILGFLDRTFGTYTWHNEDVKQNRAMAKYVSKQIKQAY